MTTPVELARTAWERVFVIHGWEVDPPFFSGHALKRGRDVVIPDPAKPGRYYAENVDTAARRLIEDYPEYAGLMARLLGELGCTSDE